MGSTTNQEGKQQQARGKKAANHQYNNVVALHSANNVEVDAI